MKINLLATTGLLSMFVATMAITRSRPPIASISSGDVVESSIRVTEPTTLPSAAPGENDSSSKTSTSTAKCEYNPEKLPENVADLESSFRALHRLTVQSFEWVPTFGANRARLYRPSYSMMRLPARHLPELFTIGGNWQAEVTKGSEAWTWLYSMHSMASRGLVYRQSDLKLDRKPSRKGNSDESLILGLPDESGRINVDDGYLKLDSASTVIPSDRLWKLQHMQLISILQHDPPVAYVLSSEWMSDTEDKTRALEHTEEFGLERLRAGEDLVMTWNESKRHADMLGAIRAKDHCLRCHDGLEPNDLLGAFTYRFFELSE